MSKLNLYQEMKRELNARKNPLLAERKTLEYAKERIGAIDIEIAAIDEEIAEYDAAIAPLLPPTPLAEVVSASEAVDGYDVGE